MKLWFAASALLILALVYLGLSLDSGEVPLEDEELQALLLQEGQESEQFKASLDKVTANLNGDESVPELKKAVEVTLAEGPDPRRASVEEIYEYVLYAMPLDRDQALEYLRRSVFDDEVRLETKLDLLESLGQGGQFPREDFGYFTREVIGQEVSPELFHKALYLHAQGMDKSDQQRIARELLERIHDNEIREIIFQFSNEP